MEISFMIPSQYLGNKKKKQNNHIEPITLGEPKTGFPGGCEQFPLKFMKNARKKKSIASM